MEILTRLVEGIRKTLDLELSLGRIDIEPRSSGTEYYITLMQNGQTYACLFLITDNLNIPRTYGYNGRHPKLAPERKVGLAAETDHGLIRLLSDEKVVLSQEKF